MKKKIYHCSKLRTQFMHQGASQSSVDIATRYGLEDRGIGLRFPAKARLFFFTPQGPDRLWGPPRLLTNGAPGLFRRR
jgi:hypothetical protein